MKPSNESQMISRYQRMNKEQEKTIIALCKELNISPDNGYIAQLLGKVHFDSKVNKGGFYQDLKYIENILNNGIPSDNKDKIAELRKILDEKEDKLNKLKNKVKEYNNNAERFEQLLEQNAREKQDILTRFNNDESREQYPNNNESLQIEDLENGTMNKTMELQKQLAEKTREIEFLKVKIEKLKKAINTIITEIKLLEDAC